MNFWKKCRTITPMAMTADELRALRVKLKLTQREIASAIGVNRPAYAQWELGRNAIPSSVQEAVLRLAARIEEDDSAIRVRATHGQLRILVELLYDCTRPADMRETAYQELLRVLGLC